MCIGTGMIGIDGGASGLLDRGRCGGVVLGTGRQRQMGHWGRLGRPQVSAWIDITPACMFFCVSVHCTCARVRVYAIVQTCVAYFVQHLLLLTHSHQGS